MARQERDAGRRRALEFDDPRAVVEPAGAVLEHLGLGPAVAALADLPAQRRIVGIDAGAAGNRRVDLDAISRLEMSSSNPRYRASSTSGGCANGSRSGPWGRAVPSATAIVLNSPPRSTTYADRRQRGDHERLGDLEHDRLVRRGAQRPDLGGRRRDLDRLLGGRGEPEADLRARGGRSMELDSEQLEQRDVELVRDPVEAIDEHVGHPCEQLDQRDPGIGDVVLGPLGTAQGDARARLGHEVLKAAVVEHDLRQMVHAVSSAGIT